MSVHDLAWRDAHHDFAASGLPAFRPQVQERLYDFYEELRNTDELFWDRHLSAWIATGHAVVSSATGNPALSSVCCPDLEAVSEELRPLAQVLSRQMLYSDAPDHSRLRGLISKAFSPRAVETLRARILEAVDRIINEVAPTGGWTSSRTSPARCR
ncbi:hypothetical protein [Streptomyces pseudovenezuelae]|uniref:Cytochrome P450 n=1 Tax=Streptomyces pseudovenezuelae TaxID=67350 RepID=A0ABT6LTN3_9ACTN|nr:hypothetical protein [Streptomyces pseudovenezuelae]MDH6219668.1 cytochrome P450 [Streptomyces pseudovenezuelae]